MPTESRHHPRGDLGTAMVLGAGAGYLDAYIYLQVTATFVANMSGNLVHIGMDAGQGHGRALLAAVLAVLSFSFGAIVATSALDRQVRAGHAHARPSLLLAIEGGLITAAAAWLALVGHDDRSALRGRDIPIVVLAATAMGIQAMSLRAVGETAVSTTYGTGALVRLSEKLALSLWRAERPTASPRRTAIIVLSCVLVSYLAGAAGGALAGTSALSLLVPVAVAFGAAWWLRREHAA